jgi:hypothetical protein
MRNTCLLTAFLTIVLTTSIWAQITVETQAPLTGDNTYLVRKGYQYYTMNPKLMKEIERDLAQDGTRCEVKSGVVATRPGSGPSEPDYGFLKVIHEGKLKDVNVMVLNGVIITSVWLKK